MIVEVFVLYKHDIKRSGLIEISFKFITIYVYVLLYKLVRNVKYIMLNINIIFVNKRFKLLI